MAEKILNSRIVNKHDTEAHWLLAAGFTPKQGELIVYDIDDNYSYERLKIGDGVQNVNALPFVDELVRNQILDPDVYSIQSIGGNKVVTVSLVQGSIDSSTGENKDDTEHLRTDFIRVLNRKFTLYSDAAIDDTFRIYVYDADKKWISDADGVGYYRVANGANASITSKAVYIKCRVSSTVTSSVLDITFDDVVQEEHAIHQKIYFPHGYNMETTEIDDNLYQLQVNAAENQFNVVTIAAPETDASEATLSLKLSDDTKSQFVDLSCMKYDDDEAGTFEIVMQARGETPLPDYIVAFNDGQGAGRVQKLKITPDAVPMQFTADGIRIRKDNTYDNNWTDDNSVTVNLAEMATKDEVGAVGALVGDTAVSEQINAALVNNQADWNQNDDTKADYIKNRPFYSENPVEESVLTNTSFDFNGDDAYFGDFSISIETELLQEIEPGVEYIVTFNGTEYRRTAFVDGYRVVIGNAAFVAGSDTGEPFLIATHGGIYADICVDNSNQSVHTISITAIKVNVHKIDMKYIPDCLMPKTTYVELEEYEWIDDGSLLYQVVEIGGVTANSKVDLQPTAYQILDLQNNDIAFVLENNDGVVTAYCLGGTPNKSYTMQVLITEVIPV